MSFSTMLMRSQSERRAYSGLSALMTNSSPSSPDPMETDMTPRGSIFAPPVPLTSPPHWVTTALSSLEQGERELQNLRERQGTEVERVNRELDNAIIGAQREERRLLEKVEQDHREAQRHLEQVKRENAAAVRVGQSLVDRQLRKMGQLKEQVQRWGGTGGGPNKNQIQRGVAEVTQPWEISLTLKRVSFVPNATTVSLGEVDVQEQCLSYPIGVCGEQGQKCALHSGEMSFENSGRMEIRRDPPAHGGRSEHSDDHASKANSGSMRVVRKLRLSSSGDDESREGARSPASKPPLSPRPRDISESSQDEELESLCSDTHGQDLFLAIPPLSSQGESEGDEPKPRTLVLVPSEEPSCSPEGNGQDQQKPRTSPKRSGGGFRSSRNLQGGGRPPSPAESEDSCYSSPRSSNLPQPRRSLSNADLSGKARSLINRGKAMSLRRTNRTRLNSASSTSDQESARSPTSSDDRDSRPQMKQAPGSNRVSRSQSMSAIEGDSRKPPKEQSLDKGRRERAETVTQWYPSLREMEEEGGSTAFDLALLVKQFGKQGSGRKDFNLPSGLHALAPGQLFVVDCGNARIQVTDMEKNVVQQVAPAGHERSARICNYFDVAVNTKGLIAMTCAAERALLVFSRHGRLLQTFGGNTIGSTHEELDAPRGVTVTCQDEFLVADIKRGTLTALKLDPKTGAKMERTIVTGFHRPYVVAACMTSGLIAVSERGNDTAHVPCIRVLDPSWRTIRILGVCSGMGPVLTCPWGLCIDSEGDVLVADWGPQHHRVLLYPAVGVGWPIITQDLSSPRGMALLPAGQLAVSDSMNHCIKIYHYK